jgi:myo-inositol-1(or 4)-monophosphatase
MENNRAYIKHAILAAKKAGKLLIELTPTIPLSAIERKTLVDEADRKVHDSIYETLKKAFPNQPYLSVFSENQSFITDGALWIIDPIVGLGNFGHGNPHYALSIALNIDDLTNVGVIYNPVFDELFTCIIGQGAYLNNNLISVSKTSHLKHALLSTRFPYDLSKEDPSTLNIYHDMTLNTEGVLNHATATLDLAYVAAGRIDGFWAKGMNAWDLTAAALLIKEAGGKVTTLSGNNHSMESTEIIATNGAIHKEVLNIISKKIKETKT